MNGLRILKRSQKHFKSKVSKLAIQGTEMGSSFSFEQLFFSITTLDSKNLSYEREI